ncbi:MAG: sialidase family protein [Betaproteobacteria bacterium]
MTTPPVLELPLSKRVSGDTPVAAACTGGSTTGSVFVNAEVEPFVVADPHNSGHLIAAWQQDRWTDGGSRAMVSATSFDGGQSWSRFLHPMSRCGGGTRANGGDYARVSDPWVDIGPSGVAYAMALGISGNAGAAETNAMLASRSTDGGVTWSAPATLILDGPAFFNDKNSLTADPIDANFVYAVWDRLNQSGGGGPTYLARSVDAGISWEPARAIYTPAGGGQTIGNRIMVLPDGTLVDVFTQIDTRGAVNTHLDVIRSVDKGATWSAPIRIAAQQAVGAHDPQTGVPIRDASILGSIAVGPDGTLWVTWQDGRFSGGQRDAVALSRSTDGGLSWSAPVAINRDTGTEAFIPIVHVRADGTAGVMHYDLRSDTNDPATLLADAWLLSSADGVVWSETKVWGPFDVAGAPRVTAGYFLGDYQGLTSIGTRFLPVLVMSSTDTSNRTDVYALGLDGLANAQAYSSAVRRTQQHAEGALSSAQFAQRVSQNIVRRMEQRLPGWSQRFTGKAPEQ